MAGDAQVMHRALAVNNHPEQGQSDAEEQGSETGVHQEVRDATASLSGDDVGGCVQRTGHKDPRNQDGNEI